MPSLLVWFEICFSPCCNEYLNNFNTIIILADRKICMYVVLSAALVISTSETFQFLGLLLLLIWIIHQPYSQMKPPALQPWSWQVWTKPSSGWTRKRSKWRAWPLTVIHRWRSTWGQRGLLWHIGSMCGMLPKVLCTSTYRGLSAERY